MLPCSSPVSRLGRRYKTSMRGVRDLMLMETAPEGASGGLLYVAELHSKSTWSKMDHLVCFLPGLQPCCSLLPTLHRAAGPVAFSSAPMLRRGIASLVTCACAAAVQRELSGRSRTARPKVQGKPAGRTQPWCTVPGAGHASTAC